ncbi:hypothetical protein [Halopenitus persicus]|uniref:Uncharacterized protein n=1 Tax=Halopenitus persicus TaxID=1048396 RepID=A0A1H3M3Z0_9EURY|nr:hypothetical protein [Halopenitus persicus]SDY71313.1 hypothetical protein SAMN05216564_108127 [Halopenitus persicus]
MHLSETDWELLIACHEKRETRPNLAEKLDITPNYVSKKLSQHSENGLISQPGPADNSGMWTTTQKGDLVVEKRKKYEKRHDELFGALVDRATEIATELNNETDRDITPTDIIITSTDAWQALHELEEESQIKTHYAAELLPQDNIYAVHGILYELWFFDLLIRTETSEGEIYDFTQKSRMALDDIGIQHHITPENINRDWLGLTPRRD